MEGDLDAADGMDGEAMDAAEGMEGEDGMDGEMDGDMEGEMDGEMDGTLAKDGSVADLGTEGNVDSPRKSIKKKGVSPKKKGKKGKKEDPNKIDLIEYKRSDKTKKWIISGKMAIPDDISDYIKEKYPKKEPVEPAEPLKEGEKPKKPRSGVNAMTE